MTILKSKIVLARLLLLLLVFDRILGIFPVL